MKSNFRRAAASLDSSTLTHRRTALDAQPLEKKWVFKEGVPCTRKRPRTQEMSREERRQLRKRLRRDLRKVQTLTSRIEVRELQVRRQSQSTGVHQSMSDAQFSVNDVRSAAGGKEVTSQLQQGDRIVDNVPSRQNRRAFQGSGFVRGQSFPKGNPKVQCKIKSLPSVDSRLNLSDSKPLARGNAAATKNLEFFAPCKAVLKKLMGHRSGWVFNTPVDAVKMGLPDYHSVIQKPMDLGTVLGRLERKEYSSTQQFASDVRLTFKNAMTYNPPGSDVHYMADELHRLFEDKWKALCRKLEIDGGELSERKMLDNRIEQQFNMKAAGCCKGGLATPARIGTSTKHKTPSGGGSLANQKGPGGQNALGPTKKVSTLTGLKAPANVDISAKNKVTEPAKLNYMGGNTDWDEMTLHVRASQLEISVQAKSSQLDKRSNAICRRDPDGNYIHDSNPNAPSHERSSASIKPNSNSNRSDPSASVNAKSPSKTKDQDRRLPTEAKLLDQPDSKNRSIREMSYEEKASMINRLQSLPGRMQDGIIRLMKERNPSLTQSDDEIEVDIDSFDNGTLWELHEQINKCLGIVDKASDPQAEEPALKRDTSKTCLQQQVEAGDEDEDVDIMDDVSQSNAPINLIDDARKEKQLSSSCSSSSESGSPSDSDSRSSSGSGEH